MNDNGAVATATDTLAVGRDAGRRCPRRVVANDIDADEDVPVALGLSGALVDADGSETLAYRIEGVPATASLSAGTRQPNGDWLLTPAELAGLELTPPTNFHGPIPLVLVGTATEAEGGSAETVRPFTVTVEAEADMPVLTPGASATDEDVEVTFGNEIVVTPTDTDGSEFLSAVTIGGVPTGAALAWTGAAHRPQTTWTAATPSPATRPISARRSTPSPSRRRSMSAATSRSPSP